MNVADLLDRQFGVKTTYELSTEGAQIGIEKTRILSYNPRRISFILVNLGVTYVNVAPDGSVSLTRGIYLVPSGGTLSMVWSEDFEMPTFEWYAIAKDAPCDYFLLEVLTQ